MTTGGSREKIKLTNNNMNLDKVKIAVIGQGYVGPPLAIEFGKNIQQLVLTSTDLELMN